MYKVFHHNFKNSVYPFRYRDLQLDAVATCMLEEYDKYVSESTGIKITGGKCITVFNGRTEKVCSKRCRASYQIDRAEQL
jgi:hypothetical protein